MKHYFFKTTLEQNFDVVVTNKVSVNDRLCLHIRECGTQLATALQTGVQLLLQVVETIGNGGVVDVRRNLQNGATSDVINTHLCNILH